VSLPLSFQITDLDAAFLALGAATQGIFQYFMVKNFPGSYPTALQAVVIAAAALGGGYLGVRTGTVPRALAVYSFGFGISQIIAYSLPRLTGG
jgi:hypothetical protein